MKRTMLFLLSLLLLGLKAASTVIENPCFESRFEGIKNVTRIEFDKYETRLYVHSTFIPGWWVKFPSTTFIRETGSDEKIIATKITGGEFDKEIFMPASGDSTFILHFPPLDKKIKKIDYGQDTKTMVYGLSLDKKQKKKPSSQAMNPGIESWITAELQKTAAHKPLETEVTPELFFNPAHSRLIGYIPGYDPRFGFETGIIYAENKLTREDFPRVVKINPEGRFEVDLLVDHPNCMHLKLHTQYIPFYIEPGQTLAMIVDWEEILLADRTRDKRYTFVNTDYRGSLAEVNRELTKIDLESYNYRTLDEWTKNKSAEEIQKEAYDLLGQNRKKIQTALQHKEISAKTAQLLEMSAQASYGAYLFRYLSDRDYYRRKDPENSFVRTPVPGHFYEFLQEIPLNNPYFVTTDVFGSFINHFEYCNLFMESDGAVLEETPTKKTFIHYIADLGFDLTEEEKELKSYIDTLTRISFDKEEPGFIHKLESLYQSFEKKYKEQLADYNELTTRLYPFENSQRFIREWQKKDSICVHQLQLTSNLSYEIIKIRSLDYFFRNNTKEESERAFLNIEKQISDPFLKQQGLRLLLKNHPPEALLATELPEGEGTEIFRRMMDPLKGKILFIDFWASWCGPCTQGITANKVLREKYKDNPDFDFVFITYEDTPEKEYEIFVEEQKLTHSYRITEDEFNHLRQLFCFNGIPKYIVIDEEGRLLKSDFAMYNFEYEWQKIQKQLPRFSDTP